MRQPSEAREGLGARGVRHLALVAALLTPATHITLAGQSRALRQLRGGAHVIATGVLNWRTCTLTLVDTLAVFDGYRRVFPVR